METTYHRTCTDVEAGKLLVVCEVCGCLRQEGREHGVTLAWRSPKHWHGSGWGVYVYHLIDQDGRVFYVGKTMHPHDRFTEHCRRFGDEIRILLVARFRDSKQALAFESDEIRRLTVDGVNLKNRRQ